MRGGANLLTAVLIGVQLAAFERPAALTIPRGTDIPVTPDENVTLKRDQVGNTFTSRPQPQSSASTGGWSSGRSGGGWSGGGGGGGGSSGGGGGGFG